MQAALPEVRFSATRLSDGQNSAESVRLHYQPGGEVHFETGRVSLDGIPHELESLAIAGLIDEDRLRAGALHFRGDMEGGGLTASLEATIDEALWRVDADPGAVDAAFLQGLPGMPVTMDWIRAGALDARLAWSKPAGGPGSLELEAQISDVAFDSPDGLYAGEGIQLLVAGEVSLDDGFPARLDGRLQAGELLLGDFYRDFSQGGLDIAARLAWREPHLEITSFGLDDGCCLRLQGRAQLTPGAPSPVQAFEVRELALQFPGAYQRYLESAAARWTLDGLAVTGRLDWSGQWRAGRFDSGDLTVSDLTVVDARQDRFAVTGLEARLRPGDHDFLSHVGWRGLLLGRINLGSGATLLDSEPGVLALTEPLQLDVLGGRLALEEFRLLLPLFGPVEPGEADVRLRAELDGLDMEQLTAALGWPRFAGTVSGTVPAVRLEQGVVEVDGEIRIEVFDGAITMDQVRLERPFGVLPSLAANIEARDLDLEQLTQTFEFGRIDGTLDGYVRDLRMLDWRPVAFDAWFGTPGESGDSRDISRKAVNRLTTLGGGTATTMLTSPLLRMFNRFSYKRLGLGCHMQNNVCELSGVKEEGESVLLMEGAGVPKVTIRAFNRRVDWPRMMEYLVSAGGGDAAPTIE